MKLAYRWIKAKRVLELARRRFNIAAEIERAIRDEFQTSLSISGNIKINKRGREVLVLVQQEKANKEIAAILQISERTVKFHVSELLQRFHAVDRRALLAAVAQYIAADNV